MDFKLPEEILDDIRVRVDHGIFGYTDPKEDYQKAVANWYGKRHGFEIGKDWNTVVPGIVYAIAVAVRAFTKPGESVIIQEPVYYPFRETIELNKRKVVNNQLVYRDGHYEIDFEDFEKKIVEENVKLFLLCSPHNPAGRVWTKEELIKLGDICVKHNVTIFADEIHSDFVFKGYKHTSFITLGEKYTENLILGTSPSKTFNIAGLQIANIIIPDEAVRSKFKIENAAAGYSQCNVVGLTATKACYEKGGQWVDELLTYLEGNLDYIRSFIKEKLPKIKLIDPEGTYLIWLDFADAFDNYRELRKFIEDEAKLWLDGGVIFGRETALFERINIASPRSFIEQAMEQLYEAYRKRFGN